MKKALSTSILSLVLIFSLLCGILSFSASALTKNFNLTQTEINQIVKDFNNHGYVLKQKFSPNYTASGKKAIYGVQKLLNMVGYTIDVDGGFGPETKSAVIKFQKARKLDVDGIVGNDTFNTLVKAAEAKLTVHDLKITAPSAVNLKPGASTSFTVQFSGVGIDRISLSTFGSGLKAVVTNSVWKAYPGTCTASIKLTASSSFTSGSVVFYLINNKIGTAKTQTIAVVKNGKSSLNVDAMLADAKNDLGKTGAQLGYKVDYCAYYVSDLLRANGCSISRAANPRDLVLNALNSKKGVYYSFRDQNVDSLIAAGLKGTDRVMQTCRSSVTPQAGDIVIFLFKEDIGSYNWSHTGIVQSFSNGKIKTIEGNTSDKSRSGIVAEKSRTYDSTVVGILRIN